MAVAYLNEGATSLAAANWSDSIGFANGAQLVISNSTANIQTALDQSASSIEYLDILGGNPIIGGVGGPLKCDADGTAESAATQVSRVKYYANGGALYFQAGGGNALAHYVLHRGGGSLYLQGGSVKHLHTTGRAYVNDQTVGASGGKWFLGPGANVAIEDNSSALVECNATQASLLLKRGTTLSTFASSNVVLDTTRASTTITLAGGRMSVLRSGTITTLYLLGGVLDLSGVAREFTITNLYHADGAELIYSRSVTITNKFAIGQGAKGVT